VNLDDVAQEIYGLSPEEFTERRNARAKEIIAAGNRELGAEVRRLPKPTVSAWLANMLVRTRAARVTELVALGQELREAQSQGARADMRRVQDRRREIIRDLVAAASQCATEAGHSMGSQVQRQLEDTLEAAVADPESAALLKAGTLSSPLAFIGFGGMNATTQRRPAKPPGEKPLRTSSSENESRGKAGTAERALAKATESLSSAQRATESAKASVEAARRRVNGASARHRAAARELREADRDRERANQELEVALQNRASAEQRLKGATGEHKRRQVDLRRQ
jgi:hypothetical protein